MQTTCTMAVKIVFDSTRIACADSRAVAYGHAVTLTMNSPRKRASGSVGLDLIPLQCHRRDNLPSDDSRRPQPGAHVKPLDICRVLELTKLEDLEKLIVIRKYRLGQIYR
jgi:hypothetical protein